MNLGYSIRKWLQTFGSNAIVIRNRASDYGSHAPSYFALICYDPYREDVIIIDRHYFTFGVIKSEQDTRNNMSDYAGTIRKLCRFGIVCAVTGNYLNRFTKFANRACDFSISHWRENSQRVHLSSPAFWLRSERPLWVYEYIRIANAHKQIATKPEMAGKCQLI